MWIGTSVDVNERSSAHGAVYISRVKTTLTEHSSLLVCNLQCNYAITCIKDFQFPLTLFFHPAFRSIFKLCLPRLWQEWVHQIYLCDFHKSVHCSWKQTNKKKTLVIQFLNVSVHMEKETANMYGQWISMPLYNSNDGLCYWDKHQIENSLNRQLPFANFSNNLEKRGGASTFMIDTTLPCMLSWFCFLILIHI